MNPCIKVRHVKLQISKNFMYHKKLLVQYHLNYEQIKYRKLLKNINEMFIVHFFMLTAVSLLTLISINNNILTSLYKIFCL